MTFSNVLQNCESPSLPIHIYTPNGVSLRIFRHNFPQLSQQQKALPFIASQAAQLWSCSRKVEANRAKVGVTNGLSPFKTPFVAFLYNAAESPLLPLFPLPYSLLCMHSSCYPTQMVQYYWKTSYMLIKWIMQR